MKFSKFLTWAIIIFVAIIAGKKLCNNGCKKENKCQIAVTTPNTSVSEPVSKPEAVSIDEIDKNNQ